MMAAISQGLRDEAFFWSLMKKPPSEYDELLGRDEKYINVEEAQKACQTAKGVTSGSNPIGKTNELNMAPAKPERYRHFSA